MEPPFFQDFVEQVLKSRCLRSRHNEIHHIQCKEDREALLDRCVEAISRIEGDWHISESIKLDLRSRSWRKLFLLLSG